MKEDMKSGRRAVRRATRIVFVLLMLGLFALPQAHAQRGQRGPVDKEEHLNKVVKELTEEVTLSEEQTTQIRVILGEQFDKQQAARLVFALQNRVRIGCTFPSSDSNPCNASWRWLR